MGRGQWNVTNLKMCALSCVTCCSRRCLPESQARHAFRDRFRKTTAVVQDDRLSSIRLYHRKHHSFTKVCLNRYLDKSLFVIPGITFFCGKGDRKECRYGWVRRFRPTLTCFIHSHMTLYPDRSHSTWSKQQWWYASRRLTRCCKCLQLWTIIAAAILGLELKP